MNEYAVKPVSQDQIKPVSPAGSGQAGFPKQREKSSSTMHKSLSRCAGIIDPPLTISGIDRANKLQT